MTDYKKIIEKQMAAEVEQIEEELSKVNFELEYGLIDDKMKEIGERIHKRLMKIITE